MLGRHSAQCLSNISAAVPVDLWDDEDVEDGLSNGVAMAVEGRVEEVASNDHLRLADLAERDLDIEMEVCRCGGASSHTYCSHAILLLHQ